MKKTIQFLIEALRSTNDPEVQKVIKIAIDLLEEKMLDSSITV